MAAMSEETQKMLVQWAEFLSSHDVAAFLGLFTDDCVYEDVALGIKNQGKTELRSFIQGVFAAMPDFHIDLKDRFVSGDRAAMEWVMSGTHAGDLPGIPATQKRFSIRGATVAELCGTKIRRNSDYWDVSAFLKQVGLMPNT
jgi:steroid delta-isomerase-like uncharacterized protein